MGLNLNYRKININNVVLKKNRIKLKINVNE